MPPRLVRPRAEQLEDRAVPAAVGALDPSFGAGGRVIDFALGGATVFDAAAVVIQPDGKIVLAGSAGGVSNPDFAVVRLNPDGSPDATFGTGGKRTVGFDRGPGQGNRDFASAVALQPDGKIVVAGTVAEAGDDADFGVIRLNADGTSDETFGPGGKRVVAFDLAAAPNNFDFCDGLVIQPDGKIVLVGSADLGVSNKDFAVARLNADGTPDATFGPGGKRTLAFDVGGLDSDRAFAVALQSDGKIVVAGRAGFALSSDFAAARFNTDGTPDATFGPGGKRVVAFDVDGVNEDRATAVLIQPDGRIVLTGFATRAGNNNTFATTRLNADGTPDGSFGPAGKRTYAGSPGQNLANGAALQPDGRIVVVGYAQPSIGGLDLDFAVLRVNPDGTPDTTFGPAGLRTVAFDQDQFDQEQAQAVAVDGNGRIVVAGAATDGGTYRLAAARLIGSVEKGPGLVVGGTPNGAALGFDPDAAGTLPDTPIFTGAPFGAVAANVRSAVGDVNGDGTADAILVTGPGTPIRVAVVSGRDGITQLVAPFDPFGGNFPGGGFVAAGDFDLDGRAEFVVTPDQGGGPRVTAFSLLPDGSTAVRANFFGIDDEAFRGGARAAVGDVNGDGVPDVAVAAGFLGGPRTALFDGKTLFATPARLLNDFFAFPGADAERLRNGAHVAAGDVDGDGFAELIFGGGPGGAPRVFVLSGARLTTGDVSGAQTNPVANYFVANNSTDRGGVRVAAADFDGDQKADVAVGSGEGSAARVRAYLGKNFAGGGEPGAFQDVTVFGGGALPGGVFVG